MSWWPLYGTNVYKHAKLKNIVFLRFRLTLFVESTHTHTCRKGRVGVWEQLHGRDVECGFLPMNLSSLCLISQTERWICCKSNQVGNIHQWDLCLRNKHSSTSIGEHLERQSRKLQCLCKGKGHGWVFPVKKASDDTVRKAPHSHISKYSSFTKFYTSPATCVFV